VVTQDDVKYIDAVEEALSAVNGREFLEESIRLNWPAIVAVAKYLEANDYNPHNVFDTDDRNNNYIMGLFDVLRWTNDESLIKVYPL